MPSWSHDDHGTHHTITVSASSVSTSEIGKTGPTFAGNAGLSETLAGKRANELRRRFGAAVYGEVLAAIEAVLAAWRPPEVTATRDTCAICKDLPAELSADLREGGSLPDTGFVDVYTLFSGAIRRCPRCATYYQFHNRFEFGFEDTDELTRLSTDEACAILEPLCAPEAAWLRSR
jgi:hypothetical protein